MKCIHCDGVAVAIDTDYNEGYCQKHFEAQQNTSEPILHVEWIGDK